FQSGSALSLPTILRTVIEYLRAPRMGKVEEEELIRLSNVDKEKGQLNGWNRVAPCPRHRPRLLAKHGRTLLGIEGLPHKWRNDVRNWFHLLIECSWSFVLFLFSIGYLGTWIFYAILYFIIAETKGASTNESRCITEVYDFASAFLFSMESQHTIGYGTRHMTTECPIAYFVLMTQCIIGVFVQTMLGGVIIAKVLRPKKRKQEMRFSDVAVIGPVDEHDRRPALFIRIADIQEKLFLAESHVRLYIAQNKFAPNGDKILVGLRDMNVGYDSGWDRVLLLWPVMVRHVIDEHSPLYGLNEEEMREKDFELIMTVEGIVEATGMTFQARTSFLPEEIVWNQKFVPIVILNEKKKKYEIQYERFDTTEAVVGWEWPPSEENEDEPHEYKSGFI
ncbi:irk-3, partial [Pristionchus pacificus]